ncbi:DUF418 domain-containing protein [Halopseudomonas salegens]|uniref:DUF418 domain-containing protein n=1 Tax=Halopseudomonas salegens TaxID=1434072 RepID=A0A1H2G756_9GAMM|nr:DUF418 domain-containing protein [Halopseudomonas salegens]SDU15423.1 uncharacterized protein SAMN05216210_2089 [Halopseudomonas salegens]
MREPYYEQSVIRDDEVQENIINSTPAAQRLVHLDVLRGFALLGILLVNFQWFSRPLQAMYVGYDPSLTGINLGADWLISWLAEGKFYPLFALLFGIGFTLMTESATAKGVRFWTVYGRRLLLLALIGLFHLAFIWPGDILLIYAICAVLMLLFFRNTPVQRLWKWTLVLIGVPALLVAVLLVIVLDPVALTAMQKALAHEKAALMDDVARASSVYINGSFSEVTSERIRSYWSYLSLDGIYLLMIVLGYFLLGRWLAVSGKVIDLPAHRRFLRRWAMVGLPLGLLLAALSTALFYQGDIVMLDPGPVVGEFLGLVAGVILPLGYLAAVLLAASKLTWLAPLGRTALSQYLLQSIIWTSVFYGYGLGLWGQVPRVWQLVLAVAFFALQVVISHWWLKRYRFGPAEWLWRSFTYWNWQPFKNEKSS